MSYKKCHKILRIEKESMSMNELNKASEYLHKDNDRTVRVVWIPPMTVASIGCAKHDDSNNYYNAELIEANPQQRLSITTRNVLKQFIDDVDLFKIKPDARTFGCGNEHVDDEGCWSGDFDMWVSIPNDLDVPAPLTKGSFTEVCTQQKPAILQRTEFLLGGLTTVKKITLYSTNGWITQKIMRTITVSSAYTDPLVPNILTCLIGTD